MASPARLGHMELALREAHAAAARGEVPIGAVLVSPAGEVVAAAGNRTRELSDPSAHAEMLVIREGGAKLGSERLIDHDLYVTLEPCPMCAQAASFFRVRRIVFGAYDPKGGGVEHGPRVFSHATCHHKPELYPGLGETEAASILRTFFAARRDD